MTVQLTDPETVAAPTPKHSPRWSKGERAAAGWALLGCAVIIAMIFIAHNARTGAVAARIANPAGRGTPSPVTPLFGWSHWLVAEQIGTIIAMVLIVVVFALLWRRYPKHPILLMAICCTTLVWQDPIMNWAPYAVYNPRLWHWPETWPLVSLSPTVEPFVVIGYVMFYLAPFFPAIWILRRLQRRRDVESFVWKHPLISLGLLIYVIGFIYDSAQEILLVRTGMYV